jgi:hypothetical protein
MTESRQPPPRGWGADELSKFLDLVRDNQYATFANKTVRYKKFTAIDGCFLRVAQNIMVTLTLT